MPVEPDPSFSWVDGAIVFVGVVVGAFLVTWLVTDVGRVRRTPYIAVLTVVALGLLAWDMSSSGTSAADLLTPHLAWAVTAALGVAAVTAIGLRRMAPQAPRHRRGFVVPFVWEGVVYGVAEAVLLAVVPVLSVWQAASALGWTDRGAAEVGSAALAVTGSLLVILVHHLGYREFRRREGRPALIGALVGCGLQALAFLLTGNVLAPVVAHILLHWQIVRRGVELPPSDAVTAPRPKPKSRPSPVLAPTG